MKRNTLLSLSAKHDNIDMEMDWDSEYGSERQSYVSVAGESIPVDDVTFLDIEEDIMGKDVMTFEYLGVTHTSYITVK